MKPLDLMDALGDLPEEYIAQELYSNTPPHRHSIFVRKRVWISTAACLLVTLGLVQGVWARQQKIQIVPPQESVPETSVQTHTETRTETTAQATTTPELLEVPATGNSTSLLTIPPETSADLLTTMHPLTTGAPVSMQMQTAAPAIVQTEAIQTRTFSETTELPERIQTTMQTTAIPVASSSVMIQSTVGILSPAIRTETEEWTEPETAEWTEPTIWTEPISTTTAVSLSDVQLVWEGEQLYMEFPGSFSPSAVSLIGSRLSYSTGIDTKKLPEVLCFHDISTGQDYEYPVIWNEDGTFTLRYPDGWTQQVDYEKAQPVVIITDLFQYYAESAYKFDRMPTEENDYLGASAKDFMKSDVTNANLMVTAVYPAENGEMYYAVIDFTNNFSANRGHIHDDLVKYFLGDMKLQPGDLLYCSNIVHLDCCFRLSDLQNSEPGSQLKYVGKAMDIFGEEFSDVIRHEMVLSYYYGVPILERNRHMCYESAKSFEMPDYVAEAMEEVASDSTISAVPAN